MKTLFILTIAISWSASRSSVTEFRKAKYLYLFNTYFDYNEDGNISKEEIDILVNNLAELDLRRRQTAFETRRKELQEDWDEFWDLLVKEADLDKNEQISISEWNKSWNDYATRLTKEKDWQILYRKLVFDYVDRDCNDVMTDDEFIPVYTIFVRDQKEVSIAFYVVSQSKSAMSRFEYYRLWKQLVTSDDARDIGNYVLGTLNYKVFDVDYTHYGQKPF